MVGVWSLTLPVRQSDLHFLDAVTKLVIDSVKSPHTKRSYADAIGQFLAFCRAQGQGILPLAKSTVNAYKSHLQTQGRSAATINGHLRAIRALATEASDNGFLGRDGEGVIAAIKRVKPERVLGTRTGMWFTAEQANRLLAEPGQERLKGIRDTALLAMLLACGLRRAELCDLLPEHIQQRDSRWVILDIKGKGGKVRTIPIPNWAMSALDAWVVAKKNYQQGLSWQSEKS